MVLDGFGKVGKGFDQVATSFKKVSQVLGKALRAVYLGAFVWGLILGKVIVFLTKLTFVYQKSAYNDHTNCRARDRI